MAFWEGQNSRYPAVFQMAPSETIEDSIRRDETNTCSIQGCQMGRLGTSRTVQTNKRGKSVGGVLLYQGGRNSEHKIRAGRLLNILLCKRGDDSQVCIQRRRGFPRTSVCRGKRNEGWKKGGEAMASRVQGGVYIMRTGAEGQGKAWRDVRRAARASARH